MRFVGRRNGELAAVEPSAEPGAAAAVPRHFQGVSRMSSTDAKPKITAMAPWFGSKRTLASAIVDELGKHRAYWEPFCGSAAVFFAKAPCSQENLCDLHGGLITLAMVLASDRCIELYERGVRTLYCRALFERCKRDFVARQFTPPGSPRDVSDTDVENAWLYLVMSWMGRNGTAGSARVNYQMAMRWTPNGGSGPTRWRNAVESIPAWHNRLRNACILHADAFKVLPRISDEDGVVIYVDPPYFRHTRGDGGGSVYEHDFTDTQHRSLAAILQRFIHARVIVSYYDDPALEDLYPGWTKRRVYRHKNLHVQNRRGVGRALAPEVLLINGASYAT